jgi:hypothetical protein
MSDGGLQNSAVLIDGRPLRDYLATPREVAKHLQCSERKLERHRLVGDGPPFVKIGAAIRYPLNELEEWLRGRLRRSTSEGGAPAGRKLHKARTETDPDALRKTARE